MTPTLALLGLLCVQSESIKPRYPQKPGSPDPIYTEMVLTIDLKGTDEALGFVRTLHPLLSMEKLVVRATGTRRVTVGKRRRFIYDEARVEMRYDDEDYEFDYTKGDPPVGGEDKLKQLMWFMAAGGRTFQLSPEGEYVSSQDDQDHNGEAMDLIALGITRLPDKAVKEGETYEVKFKGLRSEKGKKGKFAFIQKVTVEKIEKKDGKQIATLAGVLTGRLEGNEKDPNAEEAWTKVEGTSRVMIEVETGRVVSSQGDGKVVAYYKGPAENGGTNTLTMTFGVKGKVGVE